MTGYQKPIEKRSSRTSTSYSGLFPPYPFKKFAVVESFLPTGYGMPSFTLLGSAIIRLPFIPHTSLGHEFVHNWWGNSVFIDATLGNWAEALTSYTADHLYAEKRGKEEAVRYRKRLLGGYKSYAGSDPISLKEFVDSHLPPVTGCRLQQGYHAVSQPQKASW